MKGGDQGHMEDIYSFVYAQERHCITEHRRDACATKAFSN